MRFSRYIYITLIISFIILTGCTKPATKTVAGRNLADMYNPGRSSLHPDFFINHINDTASVLYIRVYPSELLFNQANDQGKYQARMKIYLELRELSPDITGGLFTDSLSIVRTLNKEDVRNSFFTGLPLKATAGKKYAAIIEINDIVRGSSTRNIQIVDKKSRLSDQNFRVINPKTGYPGFTRSFNSDESFAIQVNQPGVDSLYVDYYSLDRTLPRPAFSSAPEIPLKSYPDTTWVYAYADSSIYTLPVQGIYQFRMNPDTREGLSLFNFGETFPRIKTPDDLMGPLVYLTSSAEFRDIRMEPNRKLAIDNFWLGLNPDIASSRELIRVYYNRVYFANLYFSSFKEGWKTDRGMIYIIFGPPRLLDKSIETETWTYFTKKGSTSAVFVFKRNENQFTGLDYQLERNANSSAYWREAVGAWRKGKVYTVEY